MRELQLGSDAADGTIGRVGPPGVSESNVPCTDDSIDATDGADTTCSSTEGSSVVCTAKTKYSRKNSLKEKKRMRRERVKRKRSKTEKIRKLESKVDAEHQLRKRAEQATHSYKSMSRTYWERWRWELHKRREAMANELQVRIIATRICPGTVASSDHYRVSEIDHTMLTDPLVEGEASELFVGRGCFGIVRVQLYRGIQVAVKEFLPKSVVADVKHEASILASLCHPYLPLLFGVCTQHRPLRIVMQFHAFEGLQPSTVRHELEHSHFDGHAWVLLCAQLLEALIYLHDEVHVLHNDLKVDNILVAQSVVSTKDYQVVLIDPRQSNKTI